MKEGKAREIKGIIIGPQVKSFLTFLISLLKVVVIKLFKYIKRSIDTHKLNREERTML